MNDQLILVVFIFVLVAVLIIYQIYRWYMLYLSSQQYKEIRDRVKVLKKPLPRFQLQFGSSYLVLESKSAESYKLFSSYIHQGNNGLLISRLFPTRVRKQYDLGTTTVLWLSRTQSGKAINPTNLGVLLDETREFITRFEKTIVLLDGLEYLIIENDFDRVLKFINSLEDEVALHNSRLMVSVNPKVLDPDKKAMLEKTMKILIDSDAPSTRPNREANIKKQNK